MVEVEQLTYLINILNEEQKMIVARRLRRATMVSSKR